MPRPLPPYGAGLKFFFELNRLKRRMTSRGRRHLSMWSLSRLLGLLLMMIAGALLALGFSIMLGSVSSFFFMLGGGLLALVYWLYHGLSTRRIAPPKPGSSALPVPNPTRVLRLASRMRGDLTINRTAMELNMGYAEAEAELDALHQLGSCHLVVGDAGFVVYRFPEFLPPDAPKLTEV